MPSLRLPSLRLPQRPSLPALAPLARRLAHFWLVWSALLLLHEGGHAVGARHQGLEVRRVSVGVGPELWRGEHAGTQVVLRAVPLAGMTSIRPAKGARDAVPAAPAGWRAWREQLLTLGGGLVATLVLAGVVAAGVALRERASGARCVWGRMLAADAVVLTIFNLLPVPPLDGGRAVLGAFAAWRGAPLAGDALFWVQLGGLALAVAPMTLWTRWTARIDAVAMRWRAPAERA